jgi:hypothetical protein
MNDVTFICSAEKNQWCLFLYGFVAVAEGTPEDVVKVAASYTGHYLKPMLEKAS